MSSMAFCNSTTINFTQDFSSQQAPFIYSIEKSNQQSDIWKKTETFFCWT